MTRHASTPQALTEGRVQSFNHDIVPNYLRTRPDTDVDTKYQQIQNRAMQLTPEQVQVGAGGMGLIVGA